jgi:hypothetical protein
MSLRFKVQGPYKYDGILLAYFGWRPFIYNIPFTTVSGSQLNLIHPPF